MVTVTISRHHFPPRPEVLIWSKQSRGIR